MHVSWLICLAAARLPLLLSAAQDSQQPQQQYLYNRVDCPSWPSKETWQEELAPLLSPEAVLHGPTTTYESTCGQLSYLERLDQGNGVCLVAREDCIYEFCQPTGRPEDLNLPEYVVEAWTVCDIQAALAFANRYNIQVTVKSSGHTQIGQSTGKNSLLIWLAHFPVDDNILTDFTDSCGTRFDNPGVVRINGGEGFDSVMNSVQSKYHIVTGSDWTVSASGGWLQGGGLSWSSRQYGLGIDQVVAYGVVLTDGTLVRADACTNEDLYWALRGGAGGTFGVVTKAFYKLHPKQSVVSLYWILQGQDYLRDNDRFDDLYNFAELFLEFWIDQSPHLDNRWGGFWSAYGVGLFFWGPMEEAKNTFVEAFDDWYDNILVPNTSFQGDPSWGVKRPSETLSEWPSWYDFRTSRNNIVDDGIGKENLSFQAEGGEFSRLIPRDEIIQRPGDTLDMLMDLERNQALHPRNYILGGFINEVANDATAINPAMRKAVWSIYGRADYDGGQRMREFVSNDVTGACYNHHGPTEPDWRNALWGEHYDILLQIKDGYDPNRRLNCWHCVGYVGKEFGEEDNYIEPPCPRSGTNTLPQSQCESNGFIICVRKTIITCLEHCGSPDLVRVLQLVGWTQGRCPSGSGFSF